MPRRKVTIRRVHMEDPKYGDMEIAKFINGIMLDGKKSTAMTIFYGALDLIKEKTNEEPLAIFKKSLANVKPRLEVRPRRVGGATYQVPQEVSSKRATALAIRWILAAARARKGKPMVERLVDELLEASRNEGASVKKREDMHKMAESNRAFAHYRW